MGQAAAQKTIVDRARLRRALARARALARPAPGPVGARRARRLGAPHLGRAADHRAGLVLHDVEPDAGRPRHLRLPQPLRPHLRRRVHRRRLGGAGAAPLGSRRSRRRQLRRPRRARHVPAASTARRDGRLLPHAVAREPVHVPARAARRDPRGRRRLPVRLHGLPHRGQGRPAAPGLRDDRQALRARRAPRRDEAVAALRDGRDGHRPDPPRLLEAHGRRAPQARARQPLRARDPRLLRARRRADRQPAASRRRRHARPRRLRPRREAPRRRHPRQRVAAPRGAARDEGGARRRHLAAPGGHRLGPHDRLGRGRLLRPRLPQRRGARARGDGPGGRLRGRPRRPRRAGSRRSPTTRAGRIATRVYKPEELYARSRASRPT